MFNQINSDLNTKHDIYYNELKNSIYELDNSFETETEIEIEIENNSCEVSIQCDDNDNNLSTESQTQLNNKLKQYKDLHGEHKLIEMLKNSNNFNFCTNINCTLGNTNAKPVEKIIIENTKWNNQCVLEIVKPDDVFSEYSSMFVKQDGVQYRIKKSDYSMNHSILNEFDDINRKREIIAKERVNLEEMDAILRKNGNKNEYYFKNMKNLMFIQQFVVDNNISYNYEYDYIMFDCEAINLTLDENQFAEATDTNTILLMIQFYYSANNTYYLYILSPLKQFINTPKLLRDNSNYTIKLKYFDSTTAMRLGFIKLLQTRQKQTFLISFNGSASKTFSSDTSSKIPGYDINLLNQHLNLNITSKFAKFGMEFYQYITEIKELPNILIHDLQCSLSDKILAGT